MHNSKDSLIALSLKHQGNWDKMYKDLVAHKMPEDYFFDKVNNLECGVITMLDSGYPEQLKHVPKPPFVLYYYGNYSMLQEYRKNISVVGSRNNSEYGQKVTEELAGGLAEKGYTIVSGLALGIDAIAHQAAIDKGGRTVAVLGCGIDNFYLKTNEELFNLMKEQYLVISEYPEDTIPSPEHFPIRNRIIAGLSKTLIVTEASHHSGSIITALLALQGNADVMCVPYPAGQFSECNRLIMNGAILVESVDDVIDQMSPF